MNIGFSVHMVAWAEKGCFLSACFKYDFSCILIIILYKGFMSTASWFLHPKFDWQRRYEALRASFVDRLPAKAVAEHFGYKPGYVHLLRHLFTTGKIDLAEIPVRARAVAGASIERRVPRYDHGERPAFQQARSPSCSLGNMSRSA